MEKVILSVPSMYADHHVIAVRTALTELPGVADVVASAAFKQVIVEYDPTAISSQAIAERLEAIGYPVGDGVEPAVPLGRKGDAAWATLGLRMTQTDRRDLEMSGEFRKY